MKPGQVQITMNSISIAQIIIPIMVVYFVFAKLLKCFEKLVRDTHDQYPAFDNMFCASYLLLQLPPYDSVCNFFHIYESCRCS